MDTEDSPLICTGLPGCPYRIMSYMGTALSDADETYGVAAPSPPVLGIHWSAGVGTIVEPLTVVLGGPSGREECAMTAAVNLQRDAGLMMSNLQILAQFVTALHRMSSEMMSIGVGYVVFVAKLSMTLRAQRAAK